MEMNEKIIDIEDALKEVLEALDLFDATGDRSGFKNWRIKYGKRKVMDIKKLQILILVMWERLVALKEIGGEYPYTKDHKFCRILKACKIDPNDLDDFLTPTGL